MTHLDRLRPATPDSFERAAALLRQPPERPARRPLVLAAALAAAVGACALPVEADRTTGTVLSWTAYGTVDPANYTVRALDDAVPPTRRLAIETRDAERPSVPAGHDWPARGSWSRIRYTTSVVDPDSVAALVGALRAVVGVYNLHVEPLVQVRRVPLVAAAAGRMGVAVNPGDPSLSDRELQAFIDAQIERLDLPPESMTRRYPPRVERLPDGRRILRNSGVPFAFVLTPSTRIWVRPDAPESQAFTVVGITDDEFLFETASGWRSRAEGGWGAPIDSLPPTVRDSVLDGAGLDSDGVRGD